MHRANDMRKAALIIGALATLWAAAAAGDGRPKDPSDEDAARRRHRLSIFKRRKAQKALDEAARRAIAERWFEQPYSYMFDSGASATVSVGSGTFGRMMAGIGGLLRYGGLAPAIARFTGDRQRGFYDLSPIERLAGVPMYLQRGTFQPRRLARFNPAIIRWGYRNLIPDPRTRIGGAAAQRIYDVVFSRFFRLMTVSYRYLRQAGRTPQGERRAYLAAMTRPGFDGVDYLHKRYAGALPQYGCARNGRFFTPPMAIGFWVRRNADGTDAELWRGLGLLMRRYDRAFWRAEQRAAKRRGPSQQR